MTMKTKMVAVLAIVIIAVAGIAGFIYISGQGGDDGDVRIPTTPSDPDEPNVPDEPGVPPTPDVPPETKYPVDSVRTELVVGDYVLLQSTDLEGKDLGTIRFTVLSIIDEETIKVRQEGRSSDETVVLDFELPKDRLIGMVWAGDYSEDDVDMGTYTPTGTAVISTSFGDRLCDTYLNEKFGATMWIGVDSHILYRWIMYGMGPYDQEYTSAGYEILLESSLITKG